jgi:hypothetical protein
MARTFPCANCGQTLAVDDQFGGTQVTCTYCRQPTGAPSAQYAGVAGYAAPAAQPGYPPGYGAAGLYSVAAPARGAMIAGGVLSIVVGLFFFLGALAVVLVGTVAREALGGALPREVTGVLVVVGAILGVVALVTIVAGALTCASSPGWTLTSAILQTLFGLFALLGAVGAAAGSQTETTLPRSDPSMPQSQVSRPRGNPYGGFVMVPLSGAAAACCFIGYGQARRYREWKQANRYT